MQHRRTVILAALVAAGSAGPVLAGMLPTAAAAPLLSIAACAAALAVAGATGLDRLVRGGAAAEPEAVIAEVVRCAQCAAKDGVGALESISLGRGAPGLRRGLQLLVAGGEPESIRRTLERELDALLERRARAGGSRGVLLAAAPILGAVVAGAVLIGLIASGGTPAGLGMGAAAGVFGALLASMIAMTAHPATPAELARREAADVLARTIVIRGVWLIASGSSPRTVEQELRMLLPPRGLSGAARRAA